MDQDSIYKIIEAGTKAPSGENCQPWRFELHGETIYLYNIPERDQSLYSWGQNASLVAHGALLENMVIAGIELGYELGISLFPEKTNLDLVATIKLRKINPQPQVLYGEIEKRTTNRKPYKPVTLTATERDHLLELGSSFPQTNFYLLEDPIKKTLLAELAGMNEKILLENKHIHSFFFNHINWSKKEDEKKSIGFYIKTLELPLPVQFAFRIFRYWPVFSLLNKILKISDLVPKQNAKVYNTAAAMGLITITTKKPENFVAAGRALERIWLTTTHLNLKLQPLTGLLFLVRRIEENDIEKFSPKHVKLIKDTYEEIKNIFGVTNEIPIMLFRIGQAENPTAKSSRLPPIIKNYNQI